MDERLRSWEAAIAEYTRLATEGDRSAPEMLDVARRLAAGPAGRRLRARAWEGHLELFGPGDRDVDRAAPYLSIASDTDEIDYCLMIGEDPDDLGLEPGCFLVELRGVTRDEAGSAVDTALEEWTCRGGADEVCRVVAGLLDRIDIPPTPGGLIGGGQQA